MLVDDWRPRTDSGPPHRDKLQELVPKLIARVETADKRVGRIVPVVPARPFFAWAEQETAETGCAGVAPPDGSADTRPTFQIAGLEEHVDHVFSRRSSVRP